METDAPISAEGHSPLESFLRDYADVSGGLWDEIEPDVYDLMLPPRTGVDPAGAGAEADVVRVAFDPEALAEHPGAQLASFGTPLIDRLLADALARGRYAELFLVGLNVAPQGMADRAVRGLTLPEGASLRVERVRAMHFPQAVFWFEATFRSDQKEQEILPVAIDLHYGRQVRQLDRLLDRSHLATEPWSPLPEARHLGLEAAYPIARDRVFRTLAALANTRARELGDRLGRQVARMRRYYGDLRAEVDEQADKARGRGDDLAKFVARREALEREEQLRIGELRQKSALKVHLRLINLLKIHQPKLLLRASLQLSGKPAGAAVPLELELVWDPLSDSLEAVPCPTCSRPTFVLHAPRAGVLSCPTCESKPPAPSKPSRR